MIKNKEHVQIAEDVLPSLAERQLLFWKTSNQVFRLGLARQVEGDPAEAHFT
jgi:hypothetical protein